MRLPLLAAATAAALSLGACRNNDQHDNTQNIDENLTAENIVSNDVTAIDAVTGEAANMAADVNYTEVENIAGNESNSAAPRRLSPPPANREPTPRPKPTTDTASNSAG